jgi:hypothetical protein
VSLVEEIKKGDDLYYITDKYEEIDAPCIVLYHVDAVLREYLAYDLDGDWPGYKPGRWAKKDDMTDIEVRVIPICIYYTEDGQDYKFPIPERERLPETIPMKELDCDDEYVINDFPCALVLLGELQDSLREEENDTNNPDNDQQHYYGE